MNLRSAFLAVSGVALAGCGTLIGLGDVPALNRTEVDGNGLADAPDEPLGESALPPVDAVGAEAADSSSDAPPEDGPRDAATESDGAPDDGTVADSTSDSTTESLADVAQDLTTTEPPDGSLADADSSGDSPQDTEGAADVAQTQDAPAGAGTWTRLVNDAPGGLPANVALLTNGSVLASGSECSTQWWTLSPESAGSYMNGTWAQVGTSAAGRIFNPSAVLKDGRYLMCGGQYVSSNNCAPDNADHAQCEIFDPTLNGGTWSSVVNMPENVKDTPSSVMSDGRVLVKSFVNSSPAYILDPTISFPSSPWTLAAAFASTYGDNESSSLLLPDGTIFMGGLAFARYLPDSNSWVGVAQTPGTASGEFTNSSSTKGIGAFQLLHDGRVLVLGGNARNGLYTPPPTDMWALAADTPAPFNHAELASAVEPDGKVLTLVTNNATGAGQPSAVEYDPVADTWRPVPLPEVGSVDGNRYRMLVLPTGEIFVSGFNGGHIWLYTPSGTPQAAWRPTLSSISPLTFGSFVVSGTQLNGLTTGADLGDDAKMATNYPIVSLTRASGGVFFPRTFNVDQMAPRPNMQGGCSFQVPAGIPNGDYNVHVSANGVDSSNTLTLSLPAVDMGPAEVVAATLPNL